jgi:hypothetical protein
MGEEGWCINLEFREGSQHSQNNFIPFLQETISQARSLTKKPLLFRLDSAHDAVETRATLYNPKKVDYILRWNPRKQDLSDWLARGHSIVPLVNDYSECMTSRDVLRPSRLKACRYG